MGQSDRGIPERVGRWHRLHPLLSTNQIAAFASSPKPICNSQAGRFDTELYIDQMTRLLEGLNGLMQRRRRARTSAAAA